MPVPEIPVHQMKAPQVVPRQSLQVREDTLFSSGKGEEKKSIRQRAEKILDTLQGPLAQVLQPGEVVLYVLRCQAPASSVTKVTFGWYVQYVTACALVLTNRRLLDFHIKPKTFGGFEWVRGLRAAQWGDLAEAQAKGWLSPVLRLKYRSGKKEEYWGLKREDAKAVQAILNALLPASAGELSPAQEMVPLCPNCRAALAPDTVQCAQCGQQFKSKAEAIRRSLLFPGGGYFYVGAWGLGILDAFVESLFLGILIGFVLVGAGLPQGGLLPLERGVSPEEALWTAGFLGVLLAIEKLMTIYHAKHFLSYLPPADGKPGAAVWGAVALVFYALTGLFAAAQVTLAEPVARVGSDLAVQEAHFGIFWFDKQNNLQFRSVSSVPLKPGQLHGWVLRVRTTRPKVHVREEYSLLPPATAAGGENAGEMEPFVSVNEGDAAPDGGVIFSYWEVGDEEEGGPRKLDLYIDEQLVKSFPFVAKR